MMNLSTDNIRNMTMRSVSAEDIGENDRPTTFGLMMRDLKDIIIPWMREHNPENRWVPTPTVFKSCGLQASRVGTIAGRCPRYLESYKDDSTLFVRLHKDIA